MLRGLLKIPGSFEHINQGIDIRITTHTAISDTQPVGDHRGPVQPHIDPL